jgi:hypothetical protein
MNRLLWTLQLLGAVLYGASGTMKTFMFDAASEGVESFGALPREAWAALGVLELVCALGLVLPAALKRKPTVTVAAASVLALESLVFIWVHLQYEEVASIVMSGALGLAMAYVAYGRRRPTAAHQADL